MEWQQIIGFYHVVKLKSFTQAAEATLRTQSALTQQIKALEEEFGIEIPDEDAEKILTVGKALDYIKEKA